MTRTKKTKKANCADKWDEVDEEDLLVDYSAWCHNLQTKSDSNYKRILALEKDMNLVKYAIGLSSSLNPSTNSKADTGKRAAKEEASLEELLATLDGMEGLEDLKKHVRKTINQSAIAKKREKAGLPFEPLSLHMVFTGNPGTGKTTAARLIARIYNKAGILSTGSFIEVSRADLVGSYIGHSEKKTMIKIQEASGGILFIDEAYSLYTEDNDRDFGKNVIDVLVSEMENRRGDLLVIVAGYPKNMEKFIRSNPGLSSRFNNTFHFADFQPDELLRIFQDKLSQQCYILGDQASEVAKRFFQTVYDAKLGDFGNGREARNLVDAVIAEMASRLAQAKRITRNMLQAITVADVEAAVSIRLDMLRIPPSST